MSRISGRATTIAAALAIVLLVILLVILWTGVQRGNVARIETVGEQKTLHDNDEVLQAAYPTVADILAEENFTNEVLPKGETTDDDQENISDPVPGTKAELEYITPMKISQNQFEDPPDGSTTGKRHHSGHFRHASAEVWDPHPQYKFTAFGRPFWLRLSHDSSFASPDLKVTHMTGNTTRREHPGHELGCFYSGVVDGDPHSAVTVNLCHGMTGHVRTSTGSYYIKPAEQWRGNDKDSLESSVQHAIYKAPTRKISSQRYDDIDEQPGSRNCGVIDYDSNDAPAPLTDDNSGEEIYVGGRSRERRSLAENVPPESRGERYEQFMGQGGHHRNSVHNYNRHNRYYSVERRKSYSSEEYPQDSEMESDPFVTWRPRRALPREYFIEIMVVADAKMVKYHGQGWFSYILVLMSMVSRIYKDQSIGNPITIAVMKVVRTDEKFVGRKGIDGVSAADMLKRFCIWQNTHNPDEPEREHHDVAVLLTRENLCVNPEQQRCDTLGLAEVGRMCTPSSSCAIVQDNGLAAAFTIAHEIGHVLNMPHDDDRKCDDYSDHSGVHNVMSRMLDDKTFPWEWSKCSRHYVTEFLETGYGNCLLDKPSNSMEREDGTRLPGEDYSKNKQCELVFGRGSRICPRAVSRVCKKLWCTIPNSKDPQQCRTQHMPWADGTPCGDDKWCHRGECVSRKNLRPIDGQWGEWGRYGECSRTCGGGVKNKTRECNNPPPQNGGNFCVGERVRYRSCGTRECPPGTSDFREQQCSVFNNRRVKIPNVPENSKWHAKYMKDHQYRCILYCQLENNQYFKLDDKVIDGTPCGPDTFDICVNGQCMPAGCDHILNSDAELDTCGVCRGDNSTCQRIAGSYNTSVYGYTRVAKIPAGSSYIDIRQHGWMGSSNDSNYLALRLGEDGEYILNGDFVVNKRKVIVRPGVTIDYSGPAAVERLNSSRPISTDLILEVLSVGNVFPPQITYEYLVPKRLLNSYTWVLSDWTKCNRLCQGMKHRKAECRDTEHKDVVSDDYCREQERPREETQICNDYCTLQWEIVSESECSNHCGPGTRTVASKCLQIVLNSDYPARYIPDRACSHLERPNEQQPCTGPCEDAHWSYSEWGACSVTCGGGIQTRNAICVDSKNRPVPDKSCADQEKHVNKTCGQDTCPKWIAEWSPCSVSCGVGIRHRRHWCQVDNRIVHGNYCGSTPAGLTERCDAGPCPQWHAGKWSPCSVTCGKGEKKRKVICKDADGSTSDKCSLNDKLNDTEPCEMKSCSAVAIAPIVYSPNPPNDDPSQQDNEIDDITFRSGYEWRIKPFKECAKPCEGGYATRVVRCSSRETGRDAPDHYCDKKKKPHTKIPCSHRQCPIWEAGNWTQCDVKCGIGYQYRLLHCRSPRGEILHDNECLDEEKPEVAKECRKSPCPRHELFFHPKTNIEYKWKVSKWSACSESCGIGVQRRRVQCTIRRDSGPEKPVNDKECSNRDIKKPKSERMCRRLSCEFVWQEGAWSECSARCGHGFQNRTVSCHRVSRYGWIDPTPIEEWKCSAEKQPISQQSCRQRNCDDKFYWTVGPWKECSHPCGPRGRQTRDIYCLDRKGKTVPRRNCPNEFRPPKKQRCNQRKCAPQSCRDIQRLRKNATDDEYHLVIGGKSMFIYCHGMSTSDPKEYLTLPNENYAEFYNKILRNPGTCPYNGQRNDSCDCTTDKSDKPGRTKFRRVRLDPVRLYIIANDYTFSWTEGANRVEYGRAGDCYSYIREGCPQGRFSINLNGTQFRLSPEVTWRPEYGASMQIRKIGDQQIVGRCGGYCGACAPKPGLKLDVLPP